MLSKNVTTNTVVLIPSNVIMSLVFISVRVPLSNLTFSNFLKNYIASVRACLRKDRV